MTEELAELIISKLVIFVSIPLLIAGIICIVWMDEEPIKEKPEDINSEIED